VTDHVQLTIDGSIAGITLNRPDKLNALTTEMLDALDRVCGLIDADETVRVLLVTSSSARAFCAGADVNEWSNLPPSGMWSRWIRDGHRVFDRFARLRQPTIAVIGGLAYGGGLELALACDIRLASDTASFALPEVTIGAVPGWGGSQRLPRLIGAGRAKQMAFSGWAVDAVTAHGWGLVNEVLPPAQLGPGALELARRIADNAPVAVQAAKQLMDAGQSEGRAATLEALAAGLAAGTLDAQEGVAAFREKRKPKFTGR
jgi:enoyl-CoA hydratase